MANDFEDIDYPNIPIFPLLPNWASEPGSEILLARTIHEYRGTAQRLISFTPDVPISFDASFTTYNKEDEYLLIDFYNNRKGKNERFWSYHPKIAFELKQDMGSGATALVCLPNYAEAQYQGYERIYIVMNDGDILTRKVNNVIYDDLQDELSVEIATALDRDIDEDGYTRIGRFLLSRFDEDELNLNHKTSLTTETDLRFYELVQEYNEI
jgi:hypothetical protein